MTSTSHKSTMTIGDRHRENVATGDLRVGRLVKVVIEAKVATETVRIVVPDAEILTEVDHLRVASQAIVAPKGVVEMHVTDVDPRGASQPTADLMVEVQKHAALATVVQKDEVRMDRVLVTVGLKDAVPMHVVPATAGPTIAVQVNLVANTSDDQVMTTGVIVVPVVTIATVANIGDQAVPNSAIVGPIIETVNPLIGVRADRTSVIKAATIAGPAITSSDAAKDEDEGVANSLIVVRKAEDLLAVTAIITDSEIDNLNTMPRVVQAEGTSAIMADRANITSGITVIMVPKAADLLTMTATAGDSVAEGLNTTAIMAQAEVTLDIVADRNITVMVRISDIMADRAGMSLLIVKVAAPGDHDSLIAMAGTIMVAARNTMLGFLIRDKVLSMQNIVGPDMMVPITRDRVLIGLPWMADRQAVVQVDQTSGVVALPVAPDLVARVLVVLVQVVRVSADIIRQLKCWTQLTLTRTVS